MPKDINKHKSIDRAKTITELVICGVILTGAGMVTKTTLDNVRTVPQSQYVDLSGSHDIYIPDTTAVIDPNKIIFTSVPFQTKDKFHGDLILVNNDHQYFSTGEEDLVSICERNDEEERKTFVGFDYTYTILSKVYDPMAKMIDDFYDIYHNDTLVIYGSYRSNEYQKEIYDRFMAEHHDDDDEAIVALPGHSEHETGYAFDFSESVNYDYQGDGDFAWINENSYKYGFIVRYPKDKESITEYRYEPWHFRYVGVAHSTYMAQNGLCLEEYIDLLREQHPYSGEHLEVVDYAGQHYEIYFYPSSDAEELTGVPVPTGYRYDISGNNVDGFIVTVHKDEKVDPGMENPEAVTEPTMPSESDSDESEETTSESEETTAAED